MVVHSNETPKQKRESAKAYLLDQYPTKIYDLCNILKSSTLDSELRLTILKRCYTILGDYIDLLEK